MPADSESPETAKVFVGGLAWAIDNQKLEGHFARFGPISEAKVIFDRETGRSKGFGFVSFEGAGAVAAAAEAIEKLNEAELEGRRVNVRNADEGQRRGGGGQLPPPRDGPPPPRERGRGYSPPPGGGGHHGRDRGEPERRPMMDGGGGGGGGWDQGPMRRESSGTNYRDHHSPPPGRGRSPYSDNRRGGGGGGGGGGAYGGRGDRGRPRDVGDDDDGAAEKRARRDVDEPVSGRGGDVGNASDRGGGAGEGREGRGAGGEGYEQAVEAEYRLRQIVTAQLDVLETKRKLAEQEQALQEMIANSDRFLQGIGKR
jgi:cold-inducible RNA-binding protein